MIARLSGIHLPFAHGSAVQQAAMVLTPGGRRRLWGHALTQVCLGFLDVVAVGIAGLLGTLAVAQMQGMTLGTNGTVGRFLRFLGIQEFAASTQVIVLAALTSVLFVSRTLASIFLTRRSLRFLGRQAADISSQLIDRLLQQPLTFLQARALQELLYSTTMSVNYLVLGVLGSTLVIAADGAMLLGLGLLLLYAAPLVAVSAGGLLGVLVVALHRLTTQRAHALGEANANFDLQSRALVAEAISTYRDMYVRGTRHQYSTRARVIRRQSADVTAEWTFIPNISKYILETSVVIGALVVGGIEFALEDAQRAVGVLALFLVAGTRLAPAVIRLQQGVTQLQWSAAQGAHALHLAQEIEGTESAQFVPAERRDTFAADLSLESVTYTYPDALTPAVSDVHLRVQAGASLALVGPSGAGKSTLADLILGVLTPQNGLVRISGCPPEEAIHRWPGALAYVPQDVWIADASVRRNVTLGMQDDGFTDVEIWAALESANLSEFVRALPAGLETQVGERGARLSGGQRQRLGIARALITQPQLLVLDEATSALDSATEQDVAAAVRALHGHVTVIVVAHRLATVRDADMLIYLSNGMPIASGTFDQVRAAVPDFARQASLLGL